MPWVAGSCILNVGQVDIYLAPGAVSNVSPVPRYSVRLCFAELGSISPGERVFDVTIQGKKELSGFDITRAAGVLNRSVIKEFRRVAVAQRLQIVFTPAPGSLPPVISGVEVIAARVQ